MLTKENVLKYIKEMPDQFSLDELLDKLMLLHKIETGLEQSNNDEVIPHSEVKDRLSRQLHS